MVFGEFQIGQVEIKRSFYPTWGPFFGEGVSAETRQFETMPALIEDSVRGRAGHVSHSAPLKKTTGLSGHGCSMSFQNR